MPRLLGMPTATIRPLPVTAPSVPKHRIPRNPRTPRIPPISRIARLHRLLLLCFEESRPVVLAAFQLRYFAGIALAIASGPALTGRSVIQAVFGSVAWFGAIFYTYLYNGCMDYREDRVNGSARPIASGRLSRRTALTVARCSAAAALLTAACAGPGPLVLCTAMLLLGHAYSSPHTAWKNRTPSVMGVVFVSGLLTYAAGPLTLGVPPLSPALLLTALAMSLWMALVGAVAKDFSDIAGDAAAGRRTWAVALGERRTRVLVTVGACTVGGGFTAGALLWAPEQLPTACVVLAGAIALSVVTLAGRATDSRHERRRPYRYFMVTQHCAHLALLAQAIA
ncbi:UbiA family prenyltransferase [Streptomyces sp. NPDC048462]|uniref:UbiA family prenyltransferase n=1 Tax=Streptomyces sp. NPDC048462 TaxID=3365555 RepID=UPI003713DCAA